MIRLEAITKRYGSQEVLSGIDLEILPGEFFVILGDSGGGKTTLLNLIAGLLTPSSGKVHFGGREVTGLDAARRNVAYVFQDYALYPHMSVEANIRFPLDNLKIDPVRAAARVDEVLALLQLEPVRASKPSELSGGQKQRAAIGRALVRDPSVFLFDEPLSSLDQKLREHLRVELKQWHRRLKKTFIYVTHDQLSAMILGDRIGFLDGGILQQVAPPQEIYRQPKNIQVAQFMGFPPINLLSPRDYANLTPPPVAAGTATVGVRPEDLRMVRDPASELEIEWVQRVGYADHATVNVAGVEVCGLCAEPGMQRGDRVACEVNSPAVLCFDAAGERIPAK